MATDEQLIRQIQQGKGEAFNQLFCKYQKHIYSVCLSILNNPQDAEEVASDTFVLAYLKLDQLKNPEDFFAWLKKIAQNRSRDFLRSKRKETIPFTTALKHDTGFAIEQPSRQTAPDESLLRQELIDAIMEAIESLPQKDREVIRAHIDGLSHAEISKKLGISYQASKSRLYRARKKIAEYAKDLLNAIVGLPKMLPSEKIISGGIWAMKIGTSTKVTISVIGILVAGFIGFKIVMYQPDVQSPGVKTQPPIIAKGERSDETVAEKKFLSSKPSHQRSDVGNAITPDEQDTEQLDEREIEEFLTWLDALEEPSSADEEMTREVGQRRDEEYTEPTEPEEPAKKLMQTILEAYRNADLEPLLAVSKEKMREIFDREEYETPSAEDKALAQEIELSDSWYVGDDEFHFVLSLHGYNIEFILQRDKTGWWLVDGIPDVIETRTYYYKEIK